MQLKIVFRKSLSIKLVKAINIVLSEDIPGLRNSTPRNDSNSCNERSY